MKPAGSQLEHLDQDAPWVPPAERLLCMSNMRETPGPTQNMQERLYILYLAWRCLGMPTKLENIWIWTCCHRDPTTDKCSAQGFVSVCAEYNCFHYSLTFSTIKSTSLLQINIFLCWNFCLRIAFLLFIMWTRLLLFVALTESINEACRLCSYVGVRVLVYSDHTDWQLTPIWASQISQLCQRHLPVVLGKGTFSSALPKKPSRCSCMHLNSICFMLCREVHYWVYWEDSRVTVRKLSDKKTKLSYLFPLKLSGICESLICLSVNSGTQL